MKNFTIAATLIVATFSALADGTTYEYPQPITSNISRAEVQAQTAAAAARGAQIFEAIGLSNDLGGGTGG